MVWNEVVEGHQVFINKVGLYNPEWMPQIALDALKYSH